MISFFLFPLYLDSVCFVPEWELRHGDRLKSPTVVLQGLFPRLNTVKLTAKQQFVRSQEGHKNQNPGFFAVMEKNEESTREKKNTLSPSLTKSYYIF